MKVKHLTIYHACTANRKQWANVIFHCESLCPSINFEWQTERTVPPNIALVLKYCNHCCYISKKSRLQCCKSYSATAINGCDSGVNTSIAGRILFKTRALSTSNIILQIMSKQTQISIHNLLKSNI